MRTPELGCFLGTLDWNAWHMVQACRDLSPAAKPVLGAKTGEAAWGVFGSSSSEDEGEETADVATDGGAAAPATAAADAAAAEVTAAATGAG